MATKKVWKLNKMLLRAVLDGDESGARQAIDAGADVNHIAEGSQIGSPILIKACEDSPELVPLLLQHGAKPNHCDRLGLTALFYTTDAVAVQQLVDAGAEPNFLTEGGSTPLHGNSNPKAISALLQAGAKAYIKNKDGLLAWQVSQGLETQLLGSGHAPPDLLAEVAEAIKILRAHAEQPSLQSATQKVGMTSEEAAEKAKARRA